MVATIPSKPSEHVHAGYVKEHMWPNPFTGKGYSLRPDIIKQRIAWGVKLNQAQDSQEYEQIIQEINETFLEKRITFTQESEWKIVARTFGEYSVFNMDILCWIPWKILDIFSERHMSKDERIDAIMPFYHYVEHFLDSKKPVEERMMPPDCVYAMLPRILDATVTPLSQFAIITAHIENETGNVVRNPELLRQPIPAFVTGYHYVEPVILTKETALNASIKGDLSVHMTPNTKIPTYNEAAQPTETFLSIEAFQQNITAIASATIEAAVTATKDMVLKAALEQHPDLVLQLNDSQTRILQLQQQVDELQTALATEMSRADAFEQEVQTLTNQRDAAEQRANNLQETIDQINAHVQSMRDMATKFSAITNPKSPDAFVQQQNMLTASIG